jgi:hypothetical protein
LLASEDISVSTLWTPSGEHRPSDEGPPGEPGTAAGGQPDAELDDAAVAEELRRVREEIAGTPVVDIVANHAVGLWQLAVLHLTGEAGEEPNLEEAALAIDAMAAVVEGLGDRLGPNAEPLRDALSQLRLAYVQVRERAGVGDGGET